MTILSSGKFTGNVKKVLEGKEHMEKLWNFFETLRKEKDAKQSDNDYIMVR